VDVKRVTEKPASRGIFCEAMEKINHETIVPPIPAAVRKMPIVVSVLPPVLDQHLDLKERREDFHVEKLVP
jgi:hypothetical protein